MEEKDDVISLVDDEGNEVDFEFVTDIEHNDNTYFVLMPIEENELQDDEVNDEEPSAQVLILRLHKNEDDEESLETIEEAEENEVFEKFKKIMEEEFEFEE